MQSTVVRPHPKPQLAQIHMACIPFLSSSSTMALLLLLSILISLNGASAINEPKPPSRASQALPNSVPDPFQALPTNNDDDLPSSADDIVLSTPVIPSPSSHAWHTDAPEPPDVDSEPQPPPVPSVNVKHTDAPTPPDHDLDSEVKPPPADSSEYAWHTDVNGRRPPPPPPSESPSPSSFVEQDTTQAPCP